MKCYQGFCIYQKNNECMLEEIIINIRGQCDSYSPLWFSDEELQKYKYKCIDELEEFCEDNKDKIDDFNESIKDILESKLKNM